MDLRRPRPAGRAGLSTCAKEGCELEGTGPRRGRGRGWRLCDVHEGEFLAELAESRRRAAAERAAAGADVGEPGGHERLALALARVGARLDRAMLAEAQALLERREAEVLWRRAVAAIAQATREGIAA